MSRTKEIISAQRANVIQAYHSAKAENHIRFLQGDYKATEEYVFPNQKIDANAIVDTFYKTKCRIISVQKKTKVGADGLMIELLKLLTTHPDDDFVTNPDNVRIITGMSNTAWERDMIEKAPQCFKNKIFHHGKLNKSELSSLTNGLIIIDEIDTGDKEFQVLHKTLLEAGILDMANMEKLNIRFVVISATIIKEFYELAEWGKLHRGYKMTIPPNYIGHKDFLTMRLVNDSYSLLKVEDAKRWIQEDIINHYGPSDDYRVHIVRVNDKTLSSVQQACQFFNVIFRNHNSTDRLSDKEIKEYFIDSLSNHVVLAVKGFFRRANLIPNRWKLRIGATHEYYSSEVDNNVQIQGLTGRMTGYWREVIVGGYKTGPHRMHIRAIEEYENAYNEPFGRNSYYTAGFTKVKGVVRNRKRTMLNTRNVKNIKHVPLQNKYDPVTVPIVLSVGEHFFSIIKKYEKFGNEWDIDGILKVIRKFSYGTYKKLQHMQKHRIICPSKDHNYYNYITRYIDAAKTKTKMKPHIMTEIEKNIDLYNIYLDNREYRIIISIYKGSKNFSSSVTK